MPESSPISIVIITYNRAADMLELAQNIAGLDHQELLREVVIVNNRSTESYQTVEDFIDHHPGIPFRYLVAEENLGVSAGRNFAIQQSTAPILVFLDDDAVFENKDALLQVQNVFTEKDSGIDKPVGIAGFKVFYHSTMQMQQTAFPHKQFSAKKDAHHFDTYYFAGCAHAIRREVFEKVGYYPESFFYGMEEYDLSYRALNAGYKIVYDDRVVVLHKESPAGRLTNRDKLRGMWVNKSIVTYKYLPKKYFYSTAFLWSLEYLKKTGFDFGGWVKGWKQVKKIPEDQKRAPLSSDTLEYLEKVDARLQY